MLVVLHDETLDRTASGPEEDCSGAVSEKSLEQLGNCEVGSWFNDSHPDRASTDFEGLKLPTLKGVLRRFHDNTNFIIELKESATDPQAEMDLLNLLERFDLRKAARRGWRVFIQSFSSEALERLHDDAPHLPLLELYPQMGSRAAEDRLNDSADYAIGVGVASADVDDDFLDEAHDLCLLVNAYTVDEQSEMERLIDLEVDGIVTDVPSDLDDSLGDASIQYPRYRARGAAAEMRACTPH
jgi:glycerophosphoryl diester phosphodiesterase